MDNVTFTSYRHWEASPLLRVSNSIVHVGTGKAKYMFEFAHFSQIFIFHNSAKYSIYTFPLVKQRWAKHRCAKEHRSP